MNWIYHNVPAINWPHAGTPKVQTKEAQSCRNTLSTADLLASDLSDGTVQRVGVDGARTAFLDDVLSPAGFVANATRAAFVSSCSSDTIIHIAPEESQEWKSGVVAVWRRRYRSPRSVKVIPPEAPDALSSAAYPPEDDTT